MNLHRAAALKRVCCRANTLQGTGKEPGQVCASSSGGTEAVDSRRLKKLWPEEEEKKERISQVNSEVGRRMLGTSLLYLKERDQGNAALLEGCLFFFFFSFYLSPLPLNMKNPSKVSEKLSNQDRGLIICPYFAVPESRAEPWLLLFSFSFSVVKF